MHFDHIHPPFFSLTPPRSAPTSPLCQLLVLFYLKEPSWCWPCAPGCGHPVDHGWPARSHTFKENQPSLPSSHQPSIPPQLGVEMINSLCHAGMLTGLILCRYAMSSWLPQCCSVQKTLFRSGPPRPLAPLLCLSPLPVVPEPWRQGRDRDVLSVAGDSADISSLHLGQLWVCTNHWSWTSLMRENLALRFPS